MESVFGGRLVWYDAFYGNAAAGSEISLVPGYTYTETNAGFACRRGTTGVRMNIPSGSSAGAYADKQHVRCNYLMHGANMEMLARYLGVASSVEQFPVFWLRGDGIVAGGILGHADKNCYYFQQQPNVNSSDIYRVEASVQTLVSSFAFTTAAADIWMRFAVYGTKLYAKIWLASNPEPAAWSMTVTDTNVRLGSHFGFGFSGGNSGTVSWDNYVKDLYVWDLGLAGREAPVVLF